MERAVAINRLTKLFGKSLCYRVNDKAPTPEEREKARAELPSVRAERDRIKTQRDARCKAVLEADSEYQALKAALIEAQKRTEHVGWKALHYRLTVGRSNGIFFEVKAEGDSWQDIIDKLTPKNVAA